ncbi:MAG TPA: NAD(P)H-hydrate dehydratase [Candidatus Lachnoclostridium stercorigallinarum]|uniref:Bifunctional NAD(P)H-hydrate repair enzyme n=1 Tax=Candidatus Lachnoclostridium stercorigallinarum TaxID=2838634 RepID=A0A9D2GKD2_9FIRM|nr:NAD(P)H-hydrate dehydratase [Candidatus Lachnoclostridium stercorigallinarum]
MRYLVSGAQMKEIDRFTICDVGIPSLVLMERAAMAVAEESHRAAGPGGRIFAAAGLGNNGADAVAAARMLKEKGHPVSVILAGDPERGTEELKLQLKIAERLGVEVELFGDFIPGRCEVLIDGVFGVGLNRPVTGHYGEFLRFLQGISAKTVVAVDVPSGVSSDTGALLGPALRADVTVTFGYEKLGTAVYPGKDFRGRLVVADAGFPAEAARHAGVSAFTYEPEDVKRLPARPAYSHKGTFGKVLVVAGWKNMAGAAGLVGLAAYRMGAGLVKLLTPEENREILQTLLPEAVMIPYEKDLLFQEGGLSREDVEGLCREASAVVLGPGLGREKGAGELVRAVLSSACSPVVLDADGLNAVADNEELTRYFTENIIITPHLLEMSRLLHIPVEEIKKDIPGTARACADRWGITCVLKDAATAVAGGDGSLYINSSGCAAMAKGGSGDVLSGIIGALLAQGMSEPEAAALGVCVHGLAGERASAARGERAVLARDLADALGEVCQISQEIRKKEVNGNE